MVSLDRTQQAVKNTQVLALPKATKNYITISWGDFSSNVQFEHPKKIGRKKNLPNKDTIDSVQQEVITFLYSF